MHASRPSRRRPILACFAAALAAAGSASFAAADSVKLTGFWIDNVTVQSVAQGQLVYASPTGGRVAKPLADIEGLKLTNYPEVEQAQAALDAGDPKRAATLLKSAIGKSRQEWATLYMQRLLIPAQAAAGGADVAEAARTFAELVATDPDPFFVPGPPVDALANAADPIKTRVRESLTPMLARTPARYREAMETLLAAAGPASAPAPAAAAKAAAPAEPTRPAAAPPTAPPPSAVLLPRWADDGDPAVQMLRRGEFRQAIETLDQQMTNPNLPLARPLFFKGIAQLALADESGSEAMYKDAGLNFMRVVTFYDVKTTTVPPAMVEAGYVHQKLGRPDIATRLFDTARTLMDEEQDPAYYQRLMTLMRSE